MTMFQAANKNYLLAIACIIGLAPLRVGAFPVDSSTQASDTFTVTWELGSGVTDPNGNTNITGYAITGNAMFSAFAAAQDGSDTLLSFQLKLTNTSDNTGFESVLTGLDRFAFGTSPEATVEGWSIIAGSDGVDDVTTVGLSVDTNVQNALNNSGGDGTLLDIQAGTGNGLNPGNASSLVNQEYETVAITLRFADLNLSTPGAQVAFSPYAVKYQSSLEGANSSWQFPGGDGGGSVPSGGVPLPGTLALLGLGALLGRKRFLKPA